MSAEGLIAFIVVLGVLVAFHEFGHFIVAKAVGMQVEEFAFGFGPRILRLFKRRETEYTIHAVPLGGFVKITGQEPGEEDIPDGFMAKPIWKRALVVFAGPLFSFILAVIAFELIGVFWGFPTGKRLNRVLMVDQQTVASRMGLRTGDEILEINGKRVTDGDRMVEIIHGQPGKPITLLVDRDRRRSTLNGVVSWYVDYLQTSWSFMTGDQPVAKDVDKESAAAKAGIKSNDVLLSINGKPINGGPSMNAAIEANGEREAILELSRDKKTITVNVKPPVRTVTFAGAQWIFGPAGKGGKTEKPQAAKILDSKGPIRIADSLASVNGKPIRSVQDLLNAATSTKSADVELVRSESGKSVHASVAPGKVASSVYDTYGLLGFMTQSELVRRSFTESIAIGWEETRGLIGAIFQSLAPDKISDSVGGPILIARQTNMTVALGPYYVVRLAGMLSLSLAVINLFPIPVFDGGHLALFLIESIRRKRLTRDQMQWVQLAGLAIIGVMILAIFYSDISKWIGGKLPQ